MASEVRRRRWLWIAGALVVSGVGTWALLERPDPTASPVAQENEHEPAHQDLRPWIYGKRDARFTVVEYADLQCEYCRAYFPGLKQWIDENPQANWEWHHLPLSIHEPAATQAARWAECAGETGGTSAFWNAVTWLYANPEAVQERSPPPGFPGRSPALNHCLESQTPDGPIRAQARTAAGDGVTATPTLRLIDNTTGRDVLLEGPAEGDVLLSAMDFLMTPAEPNQALSDALEGAP